MLGVGGIGQCHVAVGNGSFFTISTSGNTYLDSVQISSSIGIEDIRQVRIGAISAPAPSQVPEPATFCLMGGSLISLGLIWRRRKR